MFKKDKKLVMPYTYKSIDKTLDEFRLEAYKLWTNIFSRETKVFSIDNIKSNYSGNHSYQLVTPKGNIIPLSWLEISVLEEYMIEQIQRIEEKKNEEIKSVYTTKSV